MGNQHTIGPWSYRAGDSVVFILGADGAAIAATDSKRYYQRHDETDVANARLIAAAPELLAQLEYAVKLLGAFPALSGTAQVQSMRDTIAKARGEVA